MRAHCIRINLIDLYYLLLSVLKIFSDFSLNSFFTLSIGKSVISSELFSARSSDDVLIFSISCVFLFFFVLLFWKRVLSDFSMSLFV